MIRFLIVSVLLNLGSPALALCNNPQNWLESPSEGVRTFIGYQHPRPNTDMQYTQKLPQDTERIGFPPPLPQAMLENPWPGRLNENEEKGGESDEENRRRFVSFFEPDGKGQWRLCREELWRPKATKGAWGRPLELTPEEVEAYALSEEAHKKNPLLVPWLKTQFSVVADIFVYDKTGRLIESFSKFGHQRESIKTGSHKCWRYDDKNRVTLHVDASYTGVCPKGAPDPHDDFVHWEYFEFNDPDDGSLLSQPSWEEKNYGHKDGHKSGGWTKDISFRKLFDPGNPNPDRWFQGANARADAKRGVTEILGGYRIGERENSIGPTFKYASGGEPPIEYLFVNNDPPVPFEMLKDPDNIYKYNRRRDTDVTKHIRLHEYFPANQTRVKERFFTAFVRTLRQEQLDDEGRLKRAINAGRFSRTDQEFGFYDEDLKKARISLKLKGHELYYRVWDYDTDGKATLVALGWGERMSLGKPDKIDEARILFGTPDGTVRWKSKEEFFQAFDFDPKAKRAFAHMYIER